MPGGVFARGMHAVFKSSKSFEVHIRRDGRWQMMSAFADQDAALSSARTHLVSGGTQEVKVVKFRCLAGMELETVILHKVAPETNGKALSLGGSAEGAPLCRTLDEFCGFESRVVIGRLLRPFLDAQKITPTELLYGWPHARKLEEQGSLLGAAIQSVARHQNEAHGVAIPVRVKELRALTDAATARARDFLAERKRLPAFDLTDLAGSSRLIDEAVGEEEHDAVFLLQLTLQLSGCGSLMGKLETLAALMDDDAEPRHLALLDGVVADILGSAETIKELLGRQANLAHGLCALADALMGRDSPPTQEPAAPALRHIGQLALRGRAPCCQSVLLERLRQSLSGDQPLDRRDPKAEGALIEEINHRLSLPTGGLLGGTAIVRAMERRRMNHRRSVLRASGMHDIADRL